MNHIRFRAGAAVAAVALLALFAGCGEFRSIVGPTEARFSTTPSVERADLTPGTEHAGAPALSFYNSDFRYTYPTGGVSLDPQRWVRIEVAAGEPVTVNWFARPRGGARIHAYRWTLDIADIFDLTPRLDEATDLAHWSRLSLSTVSATVGPFAAGEEHLLYVEAMDSNGLVSLGTVHMQVVEGSAPRVLRR